MTPATICEGIRRFFVAMGRPAPEYKFIPVKRPRQWDAKAFELAFMYGMGKHRFAELKQVCEDCGYERFSGGEHDRMCAGKRAGFYWRVVPPLPTFPNRPIYPWVPGAFEQAQGRYIRSSRQPARPVVVHEISTNADIDQIVGDILREKKEKAVQSIVEFTVPFHRLPPSPGRGDPSSKQLAVRAALELIGVNVGNIIRRSLEDRFGAVTIRCRADQFAQFMVARHAGGGENMFAEMNVKVSDAFAGVKGQLLFDVTDYVAEGKLGRTGADVSRDESNKITINMNIQTPSGEEFTRSANKIYEGRQFIDHNGDIWLRVGHDVYRNGKDLRNHSAEELLNVIRKTSVSVESCNAMDQTVRDRTLEEVAETLDARAHRLLDLAAADSSSAGRRALSDAASRSRRDSELFRSMKGGVSGAEARGVALRQAAKRGGKQFSIALKSPVDVGDLKLSGTIKAYFPVGSDDAVKIVGWDAYLSAKDKRLDWTTYRFIPFTKLEG